MKPDERTPLLTLDEIEYLLACSYNRPKHIKCDIDEEALTLKLQYQLGARCSQAKYELTS
jgi:hypothetical protein